MPPMEAKYIIETQKQYEANSEDEIAEIIKSIKDTERVVAVHQAIS
jgi:hypothetical protein